MVSIDLVCLVSSVGVLCPYFKVCQWCFAAYLCGAFCLCFVLFFVLCRCLRAITLSCNIHCIFVGCFLYFGFKRLVCLSHIRFAPCEGSSLSTSVCVWILYRHLSGGSVLVGQV